MVFFVFYHSRQKRSQSTFKPERKNLQGRTGPESYSLGHLFLSLLAIIFSLISTRHLVVSGRSLVENQMYSWLYYVQGPLSNNRRQTKKQGCDALSNYQGIPSEPHYCRSDPSSLGLQARFDELHSLHSSRISLTSFPSATEYSFSLIFSLTDRYFYLMLYLIYLPHQPFPFH